MPRGTPKNGRQAATGADKLLKERTEQLDPRKRAAFASDIAAVRRALGRKAIKLSTEELIRYSDRSNGSNLKDSEAKQIRDISEAIGPRIGARQVAIILAALSQGIPEEPKEEAKAAAKKNGGAKASTKKGGSKKSTKKEPEPALPADAPGQDAPQPEPAPETQPEPAPELPPVA